MNHTENEIIRRFAANVLWLYKKGEYFDIDGGDMHEIIVQSGLAVPGVIDQSDIDDGWPAEWDLKLGDVCEKYTDLAKKLISEGSRRE